MRIIIFLNGKKVLFHPSNQKIPQKKAVPKSTTFPPAPFPGSARISCEPGIHMIVSIHAPMRGATKVTFPNDNLPSISIHAPMRGATKGLSSRRLEISISIHAPLRGATSKTANAGTTEFTFNSRIQVGCDICKHLFMHRCFAKYSTIFH